MSATVSAEQQADRWFKAAHDGDVLQLKELLLTSGGITAASTVEHGFDLPDGTRIVCAVVFRCVQSYRC